MGDKSQLLAMTFATKYKLKIVIPGVFLGILLNHGIAVLVGNYISRFIPINYLSFLAAFVFILFGWMSLRIEEEESGEDQSLKNRGPILTIAITFFLGEFGDKTQITAMTLASEAANPFIILFGTVSAMMMTSILGIFVGMKIGKKVPEKMIKMVSSFIFVFFGLTKLYSLTGMSTVFVIALLTALAVEILLLIRFQKMQKDNEAIQNTAELLYQQNKLLSNMTETMCKGKASCGVCQGEACMIGYIKVLLKEQEKMNFENFNQRDFATLINKGYGEDMVLDALSLIIYNYVRYDFWKNENSLNKEVRRVFERILFDKSFDYDGDYNEYIQKLQDSNLQLSEKLNTRVEKRKNG